ncbi:MAG TPA: GTP 3',8-cyclase MoaA [Thermoanaerobaculia bacterium]|nr:GTP 3',8-cyclase MoaA [Thermoanaerobaculia bacterium]
MPEQTLRDSYGRTIGDLRISITDRCNFRCTYCIPVENIEWKRREEILRYEEILRLARIFAGFGVRKLRVTGGEPLLRPDVVSLLERLAEVEGIADLALTTNGKLLARFAPALRAAGVQRLNVSLDSLRPERFHRMTQRDSLGEVLEGIEAAVEAGFHPVKINAVVIRGVNDDEIVDFARFAAETGHAVRFIEFMPLDSGHAWSMDQVVPGKEIVATLRESMELVPLAPRSAAETATRWGFPGSGGEIGVIAPVTAPFCGNCNRIRLTADGQVRTCLFSMQEYDLKTPMREGASDAELETLLMAAVGAKEQGHRINRSDFVQPARTMSCIGG